MPNKNNLSPTNKNAWKLSDLKNVAPECGTVFSTFSCGGGSTMGYKRAGFDVISANDIDPVMAEHYKRNHKPKYFFLCSINELLTAKLPPEFFQLDILDGSPPCSSFSLAGQGEKTWGKLKKFREGQATQVLDTLFFEYLNLVERLQPKVSIAENVPGLVVGAAKKYVTQILQRYKSIGYKVQLFLINAADCGVPQHRPRVFFCAVRNSLYRNNLILNPSGARVSAFAATSDIITTAKEKQETAISELAKKFWINTNPGEALSCGAERLGGKNTFFNHIKMAKHKPSPTFLATCFPYHWLEPRRVSFREGLRLGSFPDDYWAASTSLGKYIIGMSVPPKMMEYVAREVYRQWLKPLTEG